MRFGASRADRLGFIVVVLLAALLALLLVTNRGSSDSTEAAADVLTVSAPPVATAIPTTAPLEIPEPTPTPTLVPIPSVPAASAEVDGDQAEDDAEADEGDDTADDEGATPDDGSASQDAGGQDTGSSTDGNTVSSASTEPSSTGGAGDGNASVPVPNPQPQATEVPNPQPQATEVPNPQPQAPANVPPPNPTGGTFTHTLTATVSQPTLYTSPGGSPFMPTFNGTALPPVNPTVFGNPLVYRVLAGTPEDEWAQVYVPARPNGTTAWVQTSQFRWGSSNRMIQINVSTNTVTVFEGSQVLLTTSAVTGKSSSRTPLAQGWVEETMPGPSGAYGPVLISLGIFSEDLNAFGGGLPKVALHGTNNPGLMGQYASNGCIRVPNDIITQIAGMVAPGSKVIITT